MFELIVIGKLCPTLARIVGWILVVVMIAFLAAAVLLQSGCSAATAPGVPASENPINDERLKRAQAEYMAGQAAGTTRALRNLRFDRLPPAKHPEESF